MALRFPTPIPEDLDKGQFTVRLGHQIKEWMRSVQEAVGGLEGTPADPSRIEAGVAADPSPTDSQAVAADDHVHNVDTAAPTVKVSYNQAPLEGTGAALMRADARLRLADGVTEGDVLWWNGSVWLSLPAQMVPGLRVPGMDGQDGEDGMIGVQGRDGAAGATGATGAAGAAGRPGMDGDQGDDGLQGPPGPTGAAGAAGATGPTGPPGILLMNGIDGQDGDDGLVGPVGPIGPTGATGPPGILLMNGIDGNDGDDGFPGPPGTAGTTAFSVDLAVSALKPAANETIPNDYCCVVSGYYEIVSGYTLTINSGAVMDIL